MKIRRWTDTKLQIQVQGIIGKIPVCYCRTERCITRREKMFQPLAPDASLKKKKNQNWVIGQSLSGMNTEPNFSKPVLLSLLYKARPV